MTDDAVTGPRLPAQPATDPEARAEIIFTDRDPGNGAANKRASTLRENNTPASLGANSSPQTKSGSHVVVGEIPPGEWFSP
jgi:hypothetical protein